MRTIIIDDERESIDRLSQLIGRHCPSLEIVGEFTGPEEALEAIDGLRPGLVFLDVEMPGMSGFEFLEVFGDRIPFRLIFTTGHNGYAVQAFRLAAVDYLLKPINKDELVTAVSRVEQLDELTRSRQIEMLIQLDNKRVMLPTTKGFMLVPISSILYFILEDGVPTAVFQDKRPSRRINKSLKELEGILGDEVFFCRIHASYLVNLRHVIEYISGDGGEVIMSNGVKLGVSRGRKDDLLEGLQKL